MKIPSRLENSPLIDCVIELRFETDLVKSAVFGVIYNCIKAEYPGIVHNLPISQLPEQLRISDPDLKYKPMYRLENEKTILQIGSDVLCISSKMPYIGWNSFYNITVDITKKVMALGFIKQISRVGFRYINFIERDITDLLKMSFRLEGNTFNTLNIRTSITKNGFTNNLFFSNDALFTQKKGSVIDIDTSKEYNDNSFYENIEFELQTAHQCEKELFFSLLKDKLLQTFEPKYDE
ncbi:MAG: TIGR04255 family protein [Paludibacteraceae bacterium]|nr:TIGR04255 family protein [Paludibacteraceae bacterium]